MRRCSALALTLVTVASAQGLRVARTDAGAIEVRRAGVADPLLVHNASSGMRPYIQNSRSRPVNPAGQGKQNEPEMGLARGRGMGYERGMPQLQLPIFPAGVTEINTQIAVQKQGSTVSYIHGHLPVFQHEEPDVRSFRMITSQMIATGTVKSREIAATFGVPAANIPG